MTVCYIGGFGRSGTTLLERVLAEASGACPLGEIVWIWERGVLGNDLCGCGVPFGECEFWRSVGDRAFGGWDRVDAAAVDRLRLEVDRTRFIPGLAARTPGLTARAREYSDYTARVYAAAREVSTASTVIDSSKHPSTAFALRLNPDVDLRVVHVVRDSRGVAYSWTKTVGLHDGPEPASTQLMYRYPPRRSALLWDTQNVAFMMLGRLGVQTRRLRFEQFLRQPRQTITELAQFLGLTADLDRVFRDAHTVRLRRSHQLSGNPMRFAAGPITLREDTAWRDALAPRSRAGVTALTWPLLVRYGYPVRRHGSDEGGRR